MTRLECGHKYHEFCINEWFEKEKNRGCPECRKIHLGKEEFPALQSKKKRAN